MISGGSDWRDVSGATVSKGALYSDGMKTLTGRRFREFLLCLFGVLGFFCLLDPQPPSK